MGGSGFSGVAGARRCRIRRKATGSDGTPDDLVDLYRRLAELRVSLALEEFDYAFLDLQIEDCFGYSRLSADARRGLWVILNLGSQEREVDLPQRGAMVALAVGSEGPYQREECLEMPPLSAVVLVSS